MNQDECNHGMTFDPIEAAKILGGWRPKNAVEFVMGNPKHAEVRRRWPRFHGKCPMCGYEGIAYASMEHYTMGDW